jgi:branched-chain amino acid transport system ATP-binding protein
VLKLEGVQAWYGKTQALFDVSLSLGAGRCLALVGANGAGKTTSIRAILGLINTRGSITLDGEHAEDVSTHLRVRRHGIAVVPEGRGLFSRLSVRENIVVGLPRSELDGLESALELFPVLKQRLHENVTNLSGGQQQMVALARAVARRPRLLLLDEPSLGLAPVMVEEIYGFLGKMRSSGLTMLLVEQSIVRARGFADELCLIRTGRSITTVDASDHDAVQRLSSLAFEATGLEDSA